MTSYQIGTLRKKQPNINLSLLRMSGFGQNLTAELEKQIVLLDLIMQAIIFNLEIY